MKIGVVGLGTMGAPMARHLVEAGHDVTVWNRTRAKEEPLAALGASRAESPAAAATGVDAVLTCVSDDPDLEAVTLGPDGVLHTLAGGAVLVDCSTGSPALARRLAEAAAVGGSLYVDAPVSGGSEGAEKGTLTVFAGGSDEAIAAARPLLDAFSGRITHLGPAGSGQAGKAVNQLILAGGYAGVAEGLVLAERAGLPLERLVEALSSGAADSWVLRNRSANIIGSAYPLGFRTSLHLKDVRIGLAEAASLGLGLPVSSAVEAMEQQVVDAGFADEDVSNLARHVRGEDTGGIVHDVPSLVAAELRLQDSVRANDVVALDQLLHEDVSYTGPDGVVVGKQEDIGSYASGRLVVESLVCDEVAARIGDGEGTTSATVVLTGVADGQPFETRMHYTRRWTLRPGFAPQVIEASSSRA